MRDHMLNEEWHLERLRALRMRPGSSHCGKAAAGVGVRDAVWHRLFGHGSIEAADFGDWDAEGETREKSTREH